MAQKSRLQRHMSYVQDNNRIQKAVSILYWIVQCNPVQSPDHRGPCISPYCYNRSLDCKLCPWVVQPTWPESHTKTICTCNKYLPCISEVTKTKNGHMSFGLDYLMCHTDRPHAWYIIPLYWPMVWDAIRRWKSFLYFCKIIIKQIMASICHLVISIFMSSVCTLL